MDTGPPCTSIPACPTFPVGFVQLPDSSYTLSSLIFPKPPRASPPRIPNCAYPWTTLSEISKVLPLCQSIPFAPHCGEMFRFFSQPTADQVLNGLVSRATYPH